MRPLLLTSTVLAALVTAPTFAQTTVPAPSEPFSRSASNISPSDTRSEIAPQLPTPPAEGARDLLGQAAQDLQGHHTGAAQEALERAETRLLDRCVPRDRANDPDQARAIQMINQARLALGHNDLQQARDATQQALLVLPRGGANGACPPTAMQSAASSPVSNTNGTILTTSP